MLQNLIQYFVFESKLSLLPLYCSHIIDIFDYESAMVYDSQNKMHKKYFEYESIDDESMENTSGRYGSYS